MCVFPGCEPGGELLGPVETGDRFEEPPNCFPQQPPRHSPARDVRGLLCMCVHVLVILRGGVLTAYESFSLRTSDTESIPELGHVRVIF